MWAQQRGPSKAFALTRKRRKASTSTCREFVRPAVKYRRLIQFEDFLTPNAYALLNKYRDRVLCFNDDIQGTAAVALGGVYASTRITGRAFADLRIMFLGAGSAATGIAIMVGGW
jgi:malate dehydrogenase (oxaloacetate-decarboxylating)(NADP+)